MKKLLASLALCLPFYLIAQGFGIFGKDQPYFADDLAVSTPIVFPHTNQVKYIWVSSDTTNGSIFTWPDRIVPLRLGQSSATDTPTNVLGASYFPNANDSDFKYVTNTSISIAISETPAFMIVTSNAQPKFRASNNYGHFWDHHTSGQGFRLYSNSVSSVVTWGLATNSNTEVPEITLADYPVNIPQGVQAMFFIQTNGYWACYTNRVLSKTLSGTFSGFNYVTTMLGRGRSWPNTSSFGGYVLHLIVWTNSITFTAQDITDVFDFTTNLYGHFGP
jgi:hypothetical protein